MLQILSLLVCIFAILSLSVFKAEMLFTVIAAGACIIAFVLSLFKKKKVMKLLSAGFIIAGCAALYLAGYNPEINPISEYMTQYHKAENIIYTNPAKAQKILDEAEAEYGFNYENGPVLYAVGYMADDDYEKCYDRLDSCNSNIFYYDTLGKLYVAANRTGKEYSFLSKKENYKKKIQEIYLRANEKYPNWAFGKEVSGIYAYENDRRLKLAYYYLIGSLGFDEKDGSAWYYLGQVEYELKYYDEALEAFKMSQKYESTEEIKECTQLYIDLITKEGK